MTEAMAGLAGRRLAPVAAVMVRPRRSLRCFGQPGHPLGAGVQYLQAHPTQARRSGHEKQGEVAETDPAAKALHGHEVSWLHLQREVRAVLVGDS